MCHPDDGRGADTAATVAFEALRDERSFILSPRGTKEVGTLHAPCSSAETEHGDDANGLEEGATREPRWIRQFSISLRRFI
jgi:hypothetical protein